MSLVKKIVLGIVSLLMVVLLGGYLFFMSEIDHMLGGNTQRVDPSKFKYLSGKLAITNVRVLAPDSKSMSADQTVLIDGNKIVSVSGDIDIPDGYQAISGEGRYLIPGLVDSHVHLKKSKNDLLLYLANGITQVGEMTGMPHQFDYLGDYKKGELSPGIYLASPKLTSSSGLNPTIRSTFEKRHRNYTTVEAAREAVREIKAQGYKAVKLSSHLNRDIYYAINDEAQKLDMPVIGHFPVGLQLDDLYNSGQSQLAHIDSIVQNLMNEFGGLYASNHQEFLEHFESQADFIANQFKQNDISLASTVWLHKTRRQQAGDLNNFFRSIPLEYQNPGWLEGSIVSKGCLPGGNSYQNPPSTSAEVAQNWDDVLKVYNEAIKIITQALVKHEVKIMAGTDALGACGMIAGFSLHNELERLYELGLSNAQILQAATLVPSIWMNTNAGVISQGYRADLVLLDKNPLDDISNTRSINAVIVNGKYINRSELDKMLLAVKKANKKSRKIGIESLVN